MATTDMGKNWGACGPFSGELQPHLTQRRLDQGLPPYQVTSWLKYTNVTDKTDRTDRQQSDSIGQTILQTVAQKLQISTTSNVLLTSVA